MNFYQRNTVCVDLSLRYVRSITQCASLGYTDENIFERLKAVRMTKIYSYTLPIETSLVDAYGALEAGFTDQFVYYRKDCPCRYMGFGRCVAVHSLSDAEITSQGPSDHAPLFFSFSRFDANNPLPPDPLFATFPQLDLMLPEVVLIEDETGCFLQVNSLGPVYEGRVARFAKHIVEAIPHESRSISYALEPDSPVVWEETVGTALAHIRSGKLSKVVTARQIHLRAGEVFTARDLLINLIDGDANGTVFLYRYGDVFFIGATPELLIRKKGDTVESMCLAGSVSAGATPAQRAAYANELLHDEKNLAEHAYVVDYLREAFGRNCHDVQVASQPQILSLRHIQHLYTPISGKMLEGMTLFAFMRELHPTPALAGAPVGEAKVLIRELEPFNRGFFGGTVGYVDGNDNGEFSVAIRSGVFDGSEGYLYAGCGIVQGSDAASEYDEIDIKLKTILSAFYAPGEVSVDGNI
jgi:isochorismate synthase